MVHFYYLANIALAALDQLSGIYLHTVCPLKEGCLVRPYPYPELFDCISLGGVSNHTTESICELSYNRL